MARINLAKELWPLMPTPRVHPNPLAGRQARHREHNPPVKELLGTPGTTSASGRVPNLRSRLMTLFSAIPRAIGM